MRVLLTNNGLDARAGSELYVRDVAIELMRRGHQPIAYSTKLGAVADELRGATVPVIQSLDSLCEIPDVIHGHHHYETLSAMMRFPETPAISYCHGWTPWQEAPLRFPRILRYVAVDELCRERLMVEGGIDPGKIELIFNFFDRSLFPPRTPLPAKPKLALAFSNTFSETSDLPILREACARCGIELHAAGLLTGNTQANPGQIMGKYDVVFAKARAAIEAMAVGTAVVLCNPGRLGPMISTQNFPSLRPLNFGVRTLSRPLTIDLLEEELQRYDAEDAAVVTQLVRTECELGPVVDRLLSIYKDVIAEARRNPLHSSPEGDRAAARYLEEFSPRYKGTALEEERDRWTRQCVFAEEDRDQWKQRYLASEQDRERWKQRCSDLEQDRDHWKQRCVVAEEKFIRHSQPHLDPEQDRNRWTHRWPEYRGKS
jgi:hypothetical protein